MAYLAPELPTLPRQGGHAAELLTLDTLRRTLSSDYVVFHGVHWSRDWRNVPAFGEADFIIVNEAGDTLVIEQKSGTLDETSEGLVKAYPGERKNVARQLHRTLDGIRDKFRWQNNADITLAYLLYLPEHRIRSLNAVGFDRSRSSMHPRPRNCLREFRSCFPLSVRPVMVPRSAGSSSKALTSFPTSMPM